MFLSILYFIFWGGFVQTAIVLAVLDALVRGNPEKPKGLIQVIRILTIIKEISLKITAFYLAFFLLILPLSLIGIGGLIFILHQLGMLPYALMQESTWDGLFYFVLHFLRSQWENLLYLPLLLIVLKQVVKWWKHETNEIKEDSAGVIRTQKYPKSVGVICAIVGIILTLVLQFMGSWKSVDLPEQELSESSAKTQTLFFGQE